MATVPDYLEFFGLKDHPFRMTPDTRYFFPSASHQRAIEIIRYGILRGEGFLVLTGEPGTGKTFLLRVLLAEKLPDKEIACILTPTLSPEELLKAILEDLNISFAPSENKENLLRKFKKYLFDLALENKNLLLVIDEAQNLPLKTLEELRLLSNLETESRKLVQILLAGQPGLEKKLNRKSMSQLKQRITIHEKLSNLTFEETLEYIRFRWHKAGGIGEIIDKKAAKILYKVSKGIPRNINKIMDRAILMAAAERKKRVNKKNIKEAIETLGLKENSSLKKKILVLILTLILLFVIAILFLMLKKP